MGLLKDSLGCGRKEPFTSGGRMGCVKSVETTCRPVSEYDSDSNAKRYFNRRAISECCKNSAAADLR